MLRKLCLMLACLLALCGCAVAEETLAAYLPEDFAGLWQLSIVVEDDMHMNMAGWNITVTLALNEDGSALMDFYGQDQLEMSWRFEDGRAFLTGYSAEGEIELAFYEDGSLLLADEVGQMYFTRPAAEEPAA